MADEGLPWKESPWLSYKDWSLSRVVAGIVDTFRGWRCPQVIPPMLAMLPDTATDWKRNPAILDAYKSLAGYFTLGATTMGPDAESGAPTENPVLVAGWDGTNLYTIKTDTSGRPQVVKIGRSLTTDRLQVTTDAGTDVIAAPGASKAIRVYGWSWNIQLMSGTIDAPDTYLHFSTSSIILDYADVPTSTAQAGLFKDSVYLGQDYIQGAENEALTLQGAGVSAGNAPYSRCTVWYEVVDV